MAFPVGKTLVGEGRTFIVAELSCNHVGRKDIAVKTIEAGARAGADAIKLQTYTAHTMTLKVDKAPFIIESGCAQEG